MKKNTKMSGQDIELFERLKRENKELKRRLKAALKIHDRIDYEHLNKFIKAQDEEGIEVDEETKVKYKSKGECRREEWKCFDCPDGWLELVVIRKPGDQYVYFRRCVKCGKRTKTQPYTGDVKK